MPRKTAKPTDKPEPAKAPGKSLYQPGAKFATNEPAKKESAPESAEPLNSQPSTLN